MASKKYGYMATIGADTSGLTSALQTMDAEAKKVSAEIREINNNLKFEDGGTVAMQQKYELLQQAIEQTKQKLDTLRNAEEKVNAAAESGKISEANQRAFQRELDSTANKFTRYQNELGNVEIALKDVGKSSEDAADKSDKAFNKAKKSVKDYDQALDNANKTTVTFGDLVKANALGDLIADSFRRAGSAVGDFIKQGITLASDLTEVQNVVDVTFGDGAAEIYAWADAAAESFGMSSLSAQEYNGTMGAMLKSMGLTDDKVKEMSMDMVGLAGDMASFYNIDIEQAFEKIRSGISGETEPLKQLGINMSVANLEAYALSQGIETAYKKMSEAEKATLRYNYLMSVTADAQGDFARTSDSFANQQRILQLQTENLAASFGEKLLPKINDLTGTLNENMPSIGENIEVVSDIVIGLFEFVIDNHKAILSVITGIGTALAAQKAGKAVGDVTVAAKGLFKTVKDGKGVMSALAASLNTQPWVLALGAVVALTAGLVALAKAATETDSALKENAAESVRAYEEQTEKASGLEKELKEVRNRIDEIKAKGKLTLTDENELALLEEQNGKLSDQLEIEKEILETKRQQAALDAVELATGDKKKEGSVAYVKSLLSINDYYLREQVRLRKAYNDAIEEGDTKTADKLQKQLQDNEKEKIENKTKILEETAALEELSKNLDTTTEEGNEAAAAIAKLKSEVSATFGIPITENAEKEIEAAETYGEYMMRKGREQAEERKKQLEQELKDYEENLKAKVTEFDDNLSLRRISEEQYYSELKKYLDDNKNLNSKAYFEQLEKYENYLDKKQSAADKAAAEEEKAEKERQDAVTKAQKEAEEERVKTIKNSWDKITRMRDRGEINEEDEYKLKAQLVKEHCDENEDTWDSYYKWLYDYTSDKEKEIADAKKEAWEDSVNELKSTLEKSYEDIKKQKEQVKKDLQSIDLTETVTDKNGNDVLVLTDLDAEIKKIDEYEASLEKLRQSGISDSLMDEIMKKDYASGDRQAFIDTLLGLSPEKLQLYYDDYERWQARQEEAATNAVADKVEETNKAAAEAVGDIFKETSENAYENGVKTAQEFLQGIIDSMEGVNGVDAISGIFNTGYGYSGIADTSVKGNSNGVGKQESTQFIASSTPITINLNDKTYIQTTIGELISKGQITGGNVFNL